MSPIHHVAALLTALFRAVLQSSWQGALAIVLVLTVRRALGTRVPARWHYGLWFLVLVRLLAPASVLPRSPASLENIRAVAQPFDQQPSTPAVPDGASVVTLPASPTAPHVAWPEFPAVVAPTTTRHPWSWQVFAALVWLAGAIALCFWLAACSSNLRRRVRRGTVPADAELAALWQDCCRRWLHRPTPPVLVAAWVHSPALVGAWRPTLLLSRQVADSFSTQDWEHVFAHEIAHLRARDHWSQLFSLAAWCVHWFNPVVWLGLRRLRADRELAADEWVLRHLQGDRALAYGETLFKTLAHRPAQLAFQPGTVGISEDGAQMKQRLRRITTFLPQRQMLGSLAGFAVVLALGSVVLGQSASAPVPRSAESTSRATLPDQRDDAEKPSAMFGHEISTIGTVSMADGTPLDGGEIVTTAYSFRGTGGFMVSRERAENGSFPLSLDEHTTQVTLAVAQKGCAVAFVGPFDAANMEQLHHLHVELTRGHTAVVQVEDGAGHPVVGARLRPYYACPSNAELPLAETTTDASGSAAIAHVGDAPLNIRVLADGFQADEATGLRLDPTHPYRWTLQPTPPLRGRVTAAATGQSIAGAVIKLAGVRGPQNETNYDPRQAPPLTNTDAQGRFILSSLRPDSRYYLFVEAPGYGGAYLREVQLAPGEMNVALDPELLIHGKLVHIPASVVHAGKVHLQYSQSFEFGDHTSGAASQIVDVQPVDGEADFVVGPFYKASGGRPLPENAPPWERKTVGLYVDSWGRTAFDVNDLPISSFVFDLAQKTNGRTAPEADTEAKRTNVGHDADQTLPVPGAETIILSLSRFAEGVTSLQFGETLGTVPSNYSKLLWQEVGDAYRLDDIRVDATEHKDAPKGRVSNWHHLISYDGQRTYDVHPGDQRVITQRAPLTHAVSDYNGSIRGPLIAFAFLDTVDQPREKLLTLQAPEHLAAVAKHAALLPSQDRVWNGHPCLAVKITDGYNRWPTAVNVSPTGYANSMDVTDVDYIAYFATDLDLYPVAWEMFNKQGEKIYTYRVKHLEPLRLAKEGGLTFRYPDSAVLHNNALDKIGWNMQEEITFYDVEVNTLTRENFTLASILAIYAKDGDTARLELLEDRDARRLTALSFQAVGSSTVNVAP